MKSTCHAAAFASCRREMSPAARKAGANARAEERRMSVRSRSKNAAARATPLGLQAGGCVRVLAAAVIANAHDLALTDDDDLEEARDEAARAETLEPLAAQLHEHPVAELDHLAGTKTIRVCTPQHRANDLIGVLARLPRVFLRGIP